MPEHEVGTGGTSAETTNGQQQGRRRMLIRLGWITAGVVFFGSQLFVVLKLFFSPGPRDRFGEPIVVGPQERFTVGSVTHFWKQRFLLVRQPTGFLALSHQCTHNGNCNVDFLPERKVIHCPCHGAEFSLTGAVLAGPAPRPLDRFAASVRNGQVVVDTSRRLRAENSS
jgi:cytochrome b6-f complex iron-sulfur subunit